MKTLITIAAICILAATAQAESLSIGNIAFGTGIENHADHAGRKVLARRFERHLAQPLGIHGQRA